MGQKHVVLRRSAVDGDVPGLHRLWHLAYQLDLQQAVRQLGPLHLDVFCEVEPPLERPCRNSAVQEIPAGIGLVHAAGHDQRVLIDGDGER